MRLPVLVRSYFKPITFCLFLLFLLITVSAVYPETNRKSLDLYFVVDGEELILKEATLVPSLAPESKHLKGGFRIEILSRENKLLFETYFRDPRIVFYDILDTTSLALSGGVVLKSPKDFTIRIPYLPEAKNLRIFAPGGTLKFQADFEQISALYRKTPLYPQWEVDTIIYNGDPSNRIDLVFLGDGYTLNDTSTYSNDIQRFINFIFIVISPYREYSTYFNVYKVKVISQESGADHLESNPPVYRNTALGAYYGCAGIDRLICAEDESVYAAAQAVPWYDEIAVIVNDPTYGGSGGDYLITYNGYWGEEVFMHELGHSFAFLADEYLYGGTGSVPNCNCDPNSVNPGWQSWIDIGSPGVGTFLGCSYDNLYRPTYDACMMRSLQSQYCVVCREQTIKSLYQLVIGYDGFFPSTDTLSITTLSPQTFELMPLMPNSHPLKVSWFVQDELRYNGNPFEFISSSSGDFIIKGMVEDTTSKVLDDPSNLLIDSKEWQVRVLPGSFICGDPNQDTKVNVSDIIFIINYLFKGGPEPSPLASADVNLDQKVTVTDIIYLINYLLKGGLEPCHI